MINYQQKAHKQTKECEFLVANNSESGGIIIGLHEYDKPNLTPLEGEQLSSCSNEGLSCSPSKEVEEKNLDKEILKKVLKDLAYKIIKQTYEEYKQNSVNLH